MKISKVNHSKTAVTTKNGIQKGIVYKDPAKGSSLNLDRHAEKLVERAAKLRKKNYEVFNLKKLKERMRIDDRLAIIGNTEVLESAQRFNRYIANNIVKAGKQNPDIRRMSDDLRTIDSRAIGYIINNAVRSSLSKATTIKAIELLLKGSLSDDDCEFIQKHFIDVIWRDCNCSDIRNAVRGIDHQNMVMQPVGRNEMVKLAPADIKDQKASKASRKDAFRNILADFAVIDEEKRTDILRKLRRIVVLYFYGQEDLPTGDFNVWKDHSDRKAETFIFADGEFKSDESGNKVIGISDTELKERIRKENIRCYRDSKSYILSSGEQQFFDDNDLNLYWLDLISESVENIYAHRLQNISEYKLMRGYLGEKVWKNLINHLSIKYIAVGKAVYNAATVINEDGSVKSGIILDKYKNGISSFDYELIKAEEELQRETAVYVASAVNNLSRAAVDRSKTGSSDIVGTKTEDLLKIARSDAHDRILQYFGGKAKWEDSAIDFSKNDGTGLLCTLTTVMASMRNESFHFYTNRRNKGSWNQDLICDLFDHDAKACGSVVKGKFYSNNLPMFYRTGDLEKLLRDLYNKPADKATQMPSFNKLLVRNSVPVYIRASVGKTPAFGTDDMIKWQSAVYYALKEIYYNEFVNSDQAKRLFIDAVSKLKASDENERRAHDDFKRKIEDIQKYDLPEICQIIMTEQNQQNQGNMKRKSAKREKDMPSIFKHYKPLLHICLRTAFTEFWTVRHPFLKNPELKEKPGADAFIPEFTCDRYTALVEKVRKDPELQKWYILSRLINPKQANQLAGSIRSYIQYTWDITRRASETGNRIVAENTKRTVEMLKDVLKVMDISIQMAGNTSNDISDYFADEDEYAEFINNFLDFDNGSFPDTMSIGAKLRAFCNQETEDGRIGIFYDGENPIMNRNIILARLYGDVKLLSQMLKDSRVSYDDICRYKNNEAKIANYKSTGECRTREDRKELSEFQTLKNHVEFRDLVDYTELIDELQGQLINWTYMRERDLMYFQLGFHYTCLSNDNCDLNLYRCIELQNGKVIDNAILYQVIAMYTNGLRVYDFDEDEEDNSDKSTGAKVSAFIKYSKKADPKDKAGESIYNAGLEVFENISEHDNMTYLRNYIDHFHYYEKHDRSMLDIYSEVFDRFFSYDMKYRKNAVNLLYNILLKHFVIARFRFDTGIKKVGRSKNATNKEMARLQIASRRGLVSEQFTYKLKDANEISYFARDERYLNNVARILYYPEEVPESVAGGIRDAIEAGEKKMSKNSPEKSKSANRDRNRYSGGKGSSGRERVSYHSKPEPKGETALARALREAQERKAAKEKE